jgi:hypothetical protein
MIVCGFGLFCWIGFVVAKRNYDERDKDEVNG